MLKLETVILKLTIHFRHLNYEGGIHAIRTIASHYSDRFPCDAGLVLDSHGCTKRGEYGPTDEREVYDDAVRLAIWDQKEAGIDTITDGEMRRWYFVQNFYGRMEGLIERPVLRQAGLYAYDSVPRYYIEDQVSIPAGLGIVDEFRFLKANAGEGQRIKACCPGPLTLTMQSKSAKATHTKIASNLDGNSPKSSTVN